MPNLKSKLKNQVNSILKKFHLEVRSTRTITNWEDDYEYHNLYDLAQKKTQMESTDNIYRRQRHYMLLQFFRSLGKPENAVAECGSWKGLSSYQMCYYLKQYYGRGFPVEYHIFDSFEGLSDPRPEDTPAVDYVTPARRGMLNCSLSQVQKNLSEFSFIIYHKGWIPEKFHEVKDKKFSFVHIDVDLYQPIKDATEFFYPRLDSNGIIVFDDYGYLQFPGAYKAVEEFVEDAGCPCIRTTTGQAVIFKANNPPVHGRYSRP